MGTRQQAFSIESQNPQGERDEIPGFDREWWEVEGKEGTTLRGNGRRRAEGALVHRDGGVT